MRLICCTMALGLAGSAVTGPLKAQATTAERSGYQATSSHAEVLDFLAALQRAGGVVRVATLATSTEGRRVPYVLAARPLVAGPAEAQRTGKPIIYLQANIHAGEVEGKEAAQMLLRDLTLGPLRPLLDSIVLIVVPIYNPDGNDHFGPASRQRPGQNGPDTVGLRPNGQGLDLNRDYVKMEAPETRGAAALLNAWDPDLFVDLHTTNGSYHGYALTYSPGLNPNSPPANSYVRDHFLPLVRERVRRRYQMEIFPYGNFINQNPDSLRLGWVTYDARPRFGTNWMGLRGRLPILSEAYSNAPFRDRVAATYHFVRAILSLAAEERTQIKAVARASDGYRPDSVAVRSTYAPGRVMEVLAEITHDAGEGSHGFARRQRTGEIRSIRMPVVDRFMPQRQEAMPAAYLVPPSLPEVVDLLRRQGIVVERLADAWAGPADQFTIDSVAVAPVVFEGHRAVSLAGRWSTAPAEVAAGWYLVSTDQRLGLLAAYLLEPASEDGVVTWNMVDRLVRRGGIYPIRRVSVLPHLAGTLLP